MGKKRKGDALSAGTKKKHKKNKRKHCTVEVPSPQGEDVPTHRPIKLKIKLGDQLISSSDATIDTLEDTSSPGGSELMGGASSSSTGGGAGGSSVDVAESSSLGIPDEDVMGSDISIGGRDDCSEMEAGEEEEEVEGEEEEEGEEQEEEAWLDALEAGEVNERGYLPHKQDSGSLTARQRAMLGGDEEGSPTSLLELPIGRSSEDLTEEMLLKKTEKNRKRRLAAQKRKEKRKAETVRKLLEKQCTKKKEEEKMRVSKKGDAPFVTYISKLNSKGGMKCTLSLPRGMELPALPVRSTIPPTVTLCTVDGCKNPKKYSDSLTHLPVCSLQCYKIVHSKAGARSPTAVAS